jgi:hypothetical protein
MTSKPAVDEVNRRLLGSETFTIESLGLVINNQTVAGLTVQTSKALEARRIAQFLHKEAKVNRNALVWLESTTGLLKGLVGMAQFGMEADRTLVQLSHQRSGFFKFFILLISGAHFGFLILNSTDVLIWEWMSEV